MRLQRVQIPNFRVLKDIDITFEEYHTPQIFPLASQNGGGKSTFLHLVFTLLISCINGDRSELIENLLKNSGVDWFSGNSKLSTITLTDNENTIEIDFAFYTINTFCHLFLFELEGEKYRNQLAKLKELGIDGYNNLYDQIKIDVQILAEENQSQEFDVNSLLKKIMIENSFSSKETEGSLALDFFAVAAILAKYPEVFQAAQLSKNTKGLMENLQASEKQRKTKTIINNRKKEL
jgi:predicted ATP-binding protein involved in virulence